MSELTEMEFAALAQKDAAPDYADPRGGRPAAKVPVPSHDRDYGDPRGDFMRFISGEAWATIYAQLNEAREAGGNPLGDAVQALMCEVGKQHEFRVKVVEIVKPDDHSDEATLRAIEFYAGSTVEPTPHSVEPTPHSPVVSVEKLELALQTHLAGIDTAPDKLSIAEFLKLCSNVAVEVEADLG